jgi:flagella basal body P-ring formation protein FlgA
MMNKRYPACIPLVIAYIVVISSLILMTSSPVTAGAWNPEDELRSYLENNYPWDELEVSNVQVTGRVSSELPESIIVEKGPLGNAVFSFLFSKAERIIVRANVRAFGRVVKNKRPLRKRHVLKDEDIYFAKMDIRKMPKSSVRDPEKLLGKALKRSITANVPIREEMIEMSRVVDRGKDVVLLLSYNGMSIRAAGKTKEKGHVGMPVKAINISSKKEVVGVLLDERTIKVEL